MISDGILDGEPPTSLSCSAALHGVSGGTIALVEWHPGVTTITTCEGFVFLREVGYLKTVNQKLKVASVVTNY